MPDRTSKPKRPRDLNELAAAIVQAATEGEPDAPPDTRDPASVIVILAERAESGEDSHGSN